MPDRDTPADRRTLVLCFTFGVSLKMWNDTGMLDREIALYEELTDYFDRIILLTYGDEEDEIYADQLPKGVELLPRKCHTNDIIYSIFAPLIHRQTLQTADVVKTNQMLGSWTAILIKYLYSVSLVVRTGYVLTDFYKRKGRHPILRAVAHMVEFLAYKTADAVLTSSHDGFEYVEERYQPPGIHKVHPNYIETDIFTPSDREPSRDLCFVGRLAPQKNLFALFEALADLSYSLTVVGEGDQREELEEHALENDVNVTFEGTIPNHKLPELLIDHRVFILPSQYEGMPKSLLEAMSCGLPCIGTDVTGINEVLTHEDTGFLCNTDPVSLRTAITRVFADEKLRKRLGTSAREHILKTYSLDEVTSAEASVYDEILTN